MKESNKRLLGIASWIPLLIFTASVIYFMFISAPLVEAQEYEQHDKLVTYLNHYYTEMFAWFAIGSTIGLIILIIFSVHLLRIKTMHPATKALWVIFMAFTGSFALPIFYYLELRNEPENIPMHASIE